MVVTCTFCNQIGPIATFFRRCARVRSQQWISMEGILGLQVLDCGIDMQDLYVDTYDTLMEALSEVLVHISTWLYRPAPAITFQRPCSPSSPTSSPSHMACRILAPVTTTSPRCQAHSRRTQCHTNIRRLTRMSCSASHYWIPKYSCRFVLDRQENYVFLSGPFYRLRDVYNYWSMDFWHFGQKLILRVV